MSASPKALFESSPSSNIGVGYMDVINWTTVDIFFAITAASLPILNALVPQRWRFSTHSLPRIGSWTSYSRSSRPDRHTNDSKRLGSEETVQPAATFSGMAQMKFHDDSIHRQDSQETFCARDSNTRIDGTARLPPLDFQRGAFSEDDRCHHRSSVPVESRWDDQKHLQPILQSHRPNWLHDSTSADRDPV